MVTKQAASETETVIENDLYRITFTNRGAQVKSWILKKFDNDEQNGLLDLVNAAAAEKYGYPLSLWTYDESLRNKLSSVLYVASREGKQTSPTTVTFEYADQDLSVRKTFSFDNTYIVNIETSRDIRKGVTLPRCPHGLRDSADQTTPAFYAAGADRLPVQQGHRAAAHPVWIYGFLEVQRHQRRETRFPGHSTGPDLRTCISRRSSSPTIPAPLRW